MIKATSVLVLGTLLLDGPGALAAEPQPSKTPHAARYEQIVSRLEPGGDLLMYASLEGILRDGLDKFSRLLKLIPNPDPDPDAQRFLEALDRLATFLEQSGVNDAAALGMSSMPMSDGMYSIRAFLSVDGLSEQKPFWRFLGGPAMEMNIHRLLPDSTVVARTANVDLSALWSLVQDGARQVGGDEGAAAFDSATATPLADGQPAVRDVLSSLSREISVSLHLSTNRNINIPLGAASVAIPEPSVLIAVATEGDTLQQALAALVGKIGLPVMTEEVNGDTLHSVNLPLPLPIPLQPTFTTHDGYFVCGSSPDIVKQALAAYGGERRLVDQDRFKAAFQGLPAEINGMLFVDRRIAEVIVETQINMYREFAELEPGTVDEFRSLMLPKGTGSTAIVRVNTPDGFLITGRNSTSGRHLLVAATTVPMGVIAGIALPALQRAKQTAQVSQCRANLNRIRVAKEAWALEDNLAEGAMPSPSDLPRFFPDGQLPACPSGGAYSLNPVGDDPTCSIEGH